MHVSEQRLLESATREHLDCIAAHVQCPLLNRVREFRLSVHDGALVLRGRAFTYHAKQLAQHAVMEATRLPIGANEIEVG